MLGETMVTGGALLGGGWLVAFRRRQKLYAIVRRQQEELLRRAGPVALGRGAAIETGPFLHGPAVIDAALDEATFAAVRDEALTLVEVERSYLPTHKKGGTVAYDTLSRRAPNIVALYLSPALREQLGRITGLQLQPTPIHDQSSLSILFYDRPGDHIGWHFDHNFYRGRHFTVLVPLVNEGSDEHGLSHARLYHRDGDEERAIASPPNRLIVFEGAEVRHRVTPIAAGERRIVLSMTFCTDPRNHWWQGIARRIKDTAFFGIRALWT